MHKEDIRLQTAIDAGVSFAVSPSLYCLLHLVLALLWQRQSAWATRKDHCTDNKNRQLCFLRLHLFLRLLNQLHQTKMQLKTDINTRARTKQTHNKKKRQKGRWRNNQSHQTFLLPCKEFQIKWHSKTWLNPQRPFSPRKKPCKHFVGKHTVV